MTKTLLRPTLEGKVYGNHERRIRALESRTTTAAASAVIGACAGVTASITSPIGPADYHVVYDTLVYDTSGGTMWTAGSPTLMTAPSAGLYLLILGITINTTTNVAVQASMFSNAPPGFPISAIKSPSTAFNNIVVSGVFKMTAGQTVFSQLSYQGEALTLFARFGANNYRNWFSMTKLV